MDILFGKFFFPFFFLIYTKHHLKKPEFGGGGVGLPHISSSVAEWKMDRKLTQW